MKRIIYTLLAATMLFTACRKENQLSSAPTSATNCMGSDLVSSKATIYGSNKKATDNDLSIDYDIVIKQVSANTYRLKGKIGGLVAKGKGMAGKSQFNDAINSMTITITGPKVESGEQLQVTLKSTAKNGSTFEFPDFEYKGELDYELLDVNSSMEVKGGSITFNDASTFTVGGTVITVNSGNFKPGNDFTIKEGTTVSIGGEKVETSFSILYDGKSGNMTFVDNSSFFMLPNGKTIEQDPKVTKVRFLMGKEGYRVMRVVVAGDPGLKVAGVFYTPKPGAEPLEFEKTVSDKKVGICCYDRCLGKDTTGYFICGTTDHFKPADFNGDGEGWARISLVSAL